MSASPAAAAGGSTKRPFEEEQEQPEAKRQALDKPKSEKEGGGDEDEGSSEVKKQSEEPEAAKPEVKAEDEASVATNGHVETNGASSDEPVKKEEEQQQQAQPGTTDAQPRPIPTTAATAAVSQAQPSQQQRQDESQFLHIRAVISSAEAATVIGKGGENVSQIRRLSGAKCTVSDYSRGAVERILTVSGMVDAVAKAFGLIIRTLNNEALEAASTPQSKTYPLRLLIPHLLIGSIIGKGGGRIREIQEASGARLNASDATLPLSTERSLVVLGVADAVHIATYYVGQTLVEQLTERFGGPAASAYANRHGQAAGAVPGGMQVVPYVPQAAHGQYLHPDNFRRHTNSAGRTPANPYGVPYLHGQAPQQGSQQPAQQQAQQSQQPQHHAPHPPQTPVHYQPPQQSHPHHGSYTGAGPHQPHAQAGGGGGSAGAGGAGGAGQHQSGMAGPPMQPALPGQPLTQQIFIPNDMVGAIIGKGGAKINEIRQLSGSVIKINEPQDNSNERLVTITGTQECNQMALYMLYSRLESEKHRI